MEVDIVLFLTSGRTFTFKQCKILTDNETTLAFSYLARSDGKTKTGTFRKDAMVGHSVVSSSESLPF